MTQLELATEMVRNHTFVSRLESDGIQPNELDVAYITRALSLSTFDSERLHGAFVRLQSRDRLRDSDLVEIDLIASACADLRGLGQPQRAWQLAAASSERSLQQLLRTPMTEVQADEARTRLGRLLYEGVKAFLDFDVRTKASDVYLRNRHLHRRLVDGNSSVLDQQILGLADEASLYAEGEIVRAQSDALDLLSGPAIPIAELNHELLRAVAINSGTTADTAALDLARRRIEESLPDAHPNDRAFLLEGLVRGVLGSDRGNVQQAVAQMKEVVESDVTVVSTTRRVQAVRTELLVVTTLGETPDHEMAARARAMADEAGSAGLTRYQHEITQLLAPD